MNILCVVLLLISIFIALKINVFQSCEPARLTESIYISSYFLYTSLILAILSIFFKAQKNNIVLLSGFLIWLPIFLLFRDICPHTDYEAYPFYLVLIAFICAIPMFWENMIYPIVYLLLLAILVVYSALS